jgi:hypothetical protein
MLTRTSISTRSGPLTTRRSSVLRSLNILPRLSVRLPALRYLTLSRLRRVKSLIPLTLSAILLA